MQLFYLIISCLLFSAKSQSLDKITKLYNGVNINPDIIFFENERIGNSDSITAQTIRRPNFAQQSQTEEQLGYPRRNFNFVPQASIGPAKINTEHPNILNNVNRRPLQTYTQTLNNPVVQNQYQTGTNNFKSVSDSITNFGINLFKQANQLQSGNNVISPYSITMLLALLQQGAKETTLQEITTALQLSSTKSAEIYQGITDEVENRKSRNVLNIANSIFVAESFNINTEFQKIATRNFKSEVNLMSFIRPELAAQTINGWVASKTNNKIDKLLAPDSLSTNTQMVLVNAVYFKGLWQVPFRPESTLPRPFEIKRGVIKTTPFMRTRRLFKTGIDSYTGAKVIILPFELDEYSLMVILPSTVFDADKVLSTLNVTQLASYHNFSAKDVELELPKFTVRADTDLAPVLTNMGITSIFGQRSELYGLGTYRSSSPQVSSALHSAVLTIDEQGGTAAAATSFAVVALSYDDPTVKFIVNRPFIAVLWDSRTSLPLFMAKVENPEY